MYVCRAICLHAKHLISASVRCRLNRMYFDSLTDRVPAAVQSEKESWSAYIGLQAVKQVHDACANRVDSRMFLRCTVAALHAGRGRQVKASRSRLCNLNIRS